VSKALEVGERIAQARREKAARERKDIRHTDMAAALKVSGATVSDWEAGKVRPRPAAMEKLARYLGVTPAYLAYGVGAELSGVDRRTHLEGTIDRGRAEGE
jgi:transcriptional regulator with XRE-family HTH domain